MFFKNIKVFLSSLLMLGVLYNPSPAWSMHPEFNNGPFERVPDDVKLVLFWNYFEPFDWISMSGVSSSWHTLANSKELWGYLAGQSPVPYNPEENKEKMEALRNLFQKVPGLHQFFSLGLSQVSLENLIPKSIESPTNASYKYFFMSRYFESLFAQKMQSNSEKDKVASLHLLSYAGHCMKRAYEEGNKKAGKKIAFRAIEETRRNPYVLYNDGFINKHYLIAALLGSFKAQDRLGDLIVQYLHQLRESDYSNAPDYMDALINLGNAWPEVRRAILDSPFKNVFEGNILHCQEISEGKQGVALCGETVLLKWPEAYITLGATSLNTSPTKAIEYFQKALENEVRISKDLFAREINPTEDNLDYLLNYRAKNPTSGTALFKLGQILINQIPPDWDGTPHGNVDGFLKSFQLAYKRLAIKQRGLPIERMGLIQNSNTIKKSAHLLNAVGNELTNKCLALRCAFLDLVMHEPCVEPNVWWIKQTIGKYLQDNWGNDLLQRGQWSPGAPKKTIEQRDVNYSLCYFNCNNNKILERNFCSNLIKVSLDKQEKDWFIKAYACFCNSVKNDGEIGVTNYNFLKVQRNKFKKIFSDTIEVEQLFNALPEVVKQNKRPNSSSETFTGKKVRRITKEKDDDDFMG